MYLQNWVESICIAVADFYVYDVIPAEYIQYISK